LTRPHRRCPVADLTRSATRTEDEDVGGRRKTGCKPILPQPSPASTACRSLAPSPPPPGGRGGLSRPPGRTTACETAAEPSPTPVAHPRRGSQQPAATRLHSPSTPAAPAQPPAKRISAGSPRSLGQWTGSLLPWPATAPGPPWPPRPGATSADLMSRMGNSTPSNAPRYQHAAADRGPCYR
jgi:hypothetical protein